MRSIRILRLMRTIGTISDELLEVARSRAQATGQTLGSLLEAALRRELATRASEGERPEAPVFRGGTGPRPGVDLKSNRSLHEALDEGVSLERRR
jgi:hypothetical protein